MNNEVKKIYDFVFMMEDEHYSKLTGGIDLNADFINMAQATSYQRIRYFIEENCNDGKNEV